MQDGWTGPPTRCNRPANPCECLPVTEAPEKLSHEDILRMRLEVLRQDHRDLDVAIRAVEESPAPDLLVIRRLKRQKLNLKDRIARIEDELTPDIIA